jgi:ABC-type multidrug transport system ATPase subunit
VAEGVVQQVHLTSNLSQSAAALAFYRAMLAHGQTVEQTGEILYRAVESRAAMPLVGLGGRFAMSDMAQRELEQGARISHQRQYPGDWVFDFVQGDGETFDYGIDYLECGICKYMQAQQASELTPYLCLLDFPMSRAMNTGLVRTTTLAHGAQRCDFRYKTGRPSRREWTPDFLKDELPHTIRMLLGLARPGAGTITLFSRPVKPGEREPLQRIGALVETPSYYPHLSGQENLEILRVLRNETPAAVQRALELVQLGKDARRPVKHYSLGMCQRLGLAMALLGNPRLLILDEPTNGLDPAGIHEMRELIRRLPAETSATVFVSSHLLNEVELIATYIGILKQGQLVFEGAPQQLHAAYLEQLTIKTDRPETACALLQQQGWSATALHDHSLRAPVAGDADIAHINQCLVQHGLAVFGLQRSRFSLEDVFLNLTASDKGATSLTH